MERFVIENMAITERRQVENLLASCELSYEDTVDTTVVLKAGQSIVGTCSSERNILKCFAVSPAYQQTGVAAQLITRLINLQFDKGNYNVLAFTKAANIPIFKGLGFETVYNTRAVALMRYGEDKLSETLEHIRAAVGMPIGVRSAIVMNCNPFTLGHLYLVEIAAAECEDVIVFVVEAERSDFPFAVRLSLAKAGVAHLPNVTVISGGDWIISQATFPQYFLKNPTERARQSAELDAGIFAEIIAKALGITRRYVGSEPYCEMTNAYNRVMQTCFDNRGLALCVIDRKRAGGQAISASHVRKLVLTCDVDALRQVVPPTTLEYLVSEEAKAVIRELKGASDC
jgi:[citrate (pro-3S)-lyase] ligase